MSHFVWNHQGVAVVWFFILMIFCNINQFLKQNWEVVPLTPTELGVTKATQVGRYKGFCWLTQL
jgi:hypothetical protein